MGYRFRRSKTILPGVKFSTTGKSTSISFGGKAGRVTLNSKGKVTNTVRIPGTGISHVSTSSILPTGGHQLSEEPTGKKNQDDEMRVIFATKEERAQLNTMYDYVEQHVSKRKLYIGIVVLAVILLSDVIAIQIAAFVISAVLLYLYHVEKKACKQMTQAIAAFFSGDPLPSAENFPKLDLEKIDQYIMEEESREVAGYEDFIDAYQQKTRYKALNYLHRLQGKEKLNFELKAVREAENKGKYHLHPILGKLPHDKDPVESIRANFVVSKADAFDLELEKIPRVAMQPAGGQLEPKEIDSMPEIRYTGVGPAFNRERLPSFVVIDTETTGLDAEEDTILELSAIRYENFKPVEAFTTLINPGVHIPKRITELNGITDEMVADAPTLAQIAPDFIAFIGQEPLAGYNVSFDLRFLYAAGIDLVTEKRKIFDVLKLCRKTYSLEHFKLADVTEYLEIYRYDAHRSLSDCLATGKVFDRVIEDIKNL